MSVKRTCECGADITNRVRGTKYCPPCRVIVKKKQAGKHIVNVKKIKEENAHLKDRNEKLSLLIETIENDCNYLV